MGSSRCTTGTTRRPSSAFGQLAVRRRPADSDREPIRSLSVNQAHRTWLPSGRRRVGRGLRDRVHHRHVEAGRAARVITRRSTRFPDFVHREDDRARPGSIDVRRLVHMRPDHSVDDCKVARVRIPADDRRLRRGVSEFRYSGSSVRARRGAPPGGVFRRSAPAAARDSDPLPGRAASASEGAGSAQPAARRRAQAASRARRRLGLGGLLLRRGRPLALRLRRAGVLAGFGFGAWAPASFRPSIRGWPFPESRRSARRRPGFSSSGVGGGGGLLLLGLRLRRRLLRRVSTGISCNGGATVAARRTRHRSASPRTRSDAGPPPRSGRAPAPAARRRLGAADR